MARLNPATDVKNNILRSPELGLAFLTICLAMFPYSPKLIQSSTQPWAAFTMMMLLFTSLLISFRTGRLPRSTVWLLISVVLVFYIQVAKLFWYPLDLKLFAGYFISIGFVWVGFNFSKVLSIALLFWVSLIWVMAGLIQIIYPAAFEFLVAGQGLSYGRGLASLAPEPSFFALHMGTLFVLAQTLPNNGSSKIQRRVLDLLIIFGLVLSGGGTALVLGSVCLAIMLLRENSFSQKAGSSVVLILAVFIALSAVELNFDRVNEILAMATATNFSEASVDASLATRFYHIGLSFQVFQNLSVLGFSSIEFSSGNIHQFGDIPTNIALLGAIGDPYTNGKLHSLLARFLVDFGLLGLCLIIISVYFIFRVINNQCGFWHAVMVVGLIAVLFTSSLPVGAGLFFFTVGSALSLGRKNEEVL